MGTTIRIPNEDLNRDGTVTLGERVASAIILWSLLFLGLNLLYWSVVTIINKSHPLAVWLDFWLAAFALLDTLFVVGLSVWRLIWLERGERREVLERNRRWKREDWEFQQVAGTVETVGDTRWTAATQDYYAKLYLQRYYQNQSIVRDDWVRDGLPKPAWDTINALMVKRRIRQGRKTELAYDTFADAWAAWVEAEAKSRKWVRVGDDFVKQ